MSKHKSSSGTVAAPVAPKSAAERTAQHPSTLGASRSLAVGEIHVEPGWNARTVFDDAEIAALAENILAIGQLQEVVVCPRTEGGYSLVVGEKRCRAIAKNHGEGKGDGMVRALVVANRSIGMMVAENFYRSNPPPSDYCKLVKRLREEDPKRTNRSVAAECLISEQQASNFYGIATKMAPDVWDEWSKRSDESGALRWAVEHYSAPHETQRPAWAAWKKRRDAVEGGKSKKATGAGSDDGGPVMMKRDEIVNLACGLHCAVELGTDVDSTCETWLECIRYLMTQSSAAMPQMVRDAMAHAEAKRTKMGAKGAYRPEALVFELTGKGANPSAAPAGAATAPAAEAEAE